MTTIEKDELLRPTANLVGHKLAGLLEIEAERRRSDQYERWFRSGNRQIRALDFEQQRFAALVRAIDALVWVTDPDRTIHWTSRSLHEHHTPPDPRGSWAGQSCEAFCQPEERSCTPECGGCVAARVLATGQIVSCEWRTSDPGGEHTAYVTGLPISDLEGRVREVLLVLRKRPATTTTA